jgi:hypothetical protein
MQIVLGKSSSGTRGHDMDIGRYNSEPGAYGAADTALALAAGAIAEM